MKLIKDASSIKNKKKISETKAKDKKDSKKHITTEKNVKLGSIKKKKLVLSRKDDDGGKISMHPNVDKSLKKKKASKKKNESMSSDDSPKKKKKINIEVEYEEDFENSIRDKVEKSPESKRKSVTWADQISSEEQNNDESDENSQFEKPNKQTFEIAKKSNKRKTKDTNADGSKKIKLEQLSKKDRKTERKKNENVRFDISMRIKKIWETVRNEKCPADKKEILLNELSNLILGKVKELIFAHDTVRVIESLVALGTEEHRTKLFDELKEEIIALSKSKYAKFFVLKMLKYGTKQQKDFIIKTLQGQVMKLIKHSEAANIVECAYNECANAIQRSQLMEEFYGSKFAIFKDEGIRTLGEVLSKDQSQKDQIIPHMKGILMNLIEKSVIKHSIVHHALREFITHADAASRSELIEASREIVVQVLHTKDGSRFAMNCFWHGTPKDRKAIIKSMKTHVKKICSEEEGHLVLLTLFDCVDDTKIVEKIIIHEIGQAIHHIADNIHGRKVLNYLLSPRDSHYFHPDIVGLLKQGDGNKYSKKDVDVRRKELLEATSKILVDFFNLKAKDLLTSNAHCLLVLAILKNSTVDLKESYEKIAKLVSEPYKPATDAYTHLVEHPSANFFLKKLILQEKERHNNDLSTSFLDTLVSILPKKSLSQWINCNRGAFLTLTLLETEVPAMVKYVKKELSSSKSNLQKKDYKGAKLLLSKL